MTDEQFEKFTAMMQAQTEAMQAQTKVLEKILTDLGSEIKFLRKAETLKTALDLCKTRSTENVPLQEEGGLAGAIEDIGKFLESGKTPENWKDSVTNEIYIKTFSGKPLKVDEI